MRILSIGIVRASHDSCNNAVVSARCQVHSRPLVPPVAVCVAVLAAAAGSRAVGRRWHLYVASSHIGDLIFSNDLVLTEHSNLLGDVPRGVGLIDESDLDRRLFSIPRNGLHLFTHLAENGVQCVACLPSLIHGSAVPRLL